MIDYEDVIRKVADYLQDSDIPLQITHQEEFAEGWLFRFQKTEYVETGNSFAQLAGSGPFLIEKDTGELHVLGAEYPSKNI